MCLVVSKVYYRFSFFSICCLPFLRSVFACLNCDKDYRNFEQINFVSFSLSLSLSLKVLCLSGKNVKKFATEEALNLVFRFWYLFLISDSFECLLQNQKSRKNTETTKLKYCKIIFVKILRFFLTRTFVWSRRGHLKRSKNECSKVLRNCHRNNRGAGGPSY